MKKSNVLRAFLLTLTLSFTHLLFAQDDLNPKVKFYNGKVEYQAPSKTTKVLGIAGAFLNTPTKELRVEDKSLVEGITEAIHAAAVHHGRLIHQQGEAPQELTEEVCYRLDAKLMDVMSGNGDNAIADANVELIIVNTKTGKATHREHFTCGSVRNSNATKAEAIASLHNDVTSTTLHFLLANFPITGSILQKGVEQLNGKVKEKQCYIDLGEMHKVEKGYHFAVYVDKDGKQEEIGTLKLINTEGDDVSVCSITKGNKKIEKALEAGQHLTIKTKPY